MTRIYFISTFFCLLTWQSFGQISFYKSFSDGGTEVGHGITQLPDSSYLITGLSSSFVPNAQAFILALDSLGNKKWSNHYGGAESEHGRRIFHVPNDGIYVAGQTNSFGNFFDAYFFKTDLSGNLIFEKNYGSSAYENIHDAIQLKDTSFILVGETYNTSNGTENIYMLRINRFGDTLWTKNFGTDQKDIARSVKLMDDTTVVIAGEYYVTDSLTQKGLLIKMHINGTIEWLKTYGTLGKYVINDLAIDNGAIRSVGYNQEDLSIEGANRQLLLKTDLDGNVIFEKSEIHNGNFELRYIVKYGFNNYDYYLVNKFENSNEAGSNNGESDMFIYKFETNLYFNGLQIETSFSGDDIANHFIATSDGGAILVGENNFPTNNGSNIVVAKIGPGDYFPYAFMSPQSNSLVGIKAISQEKTLKIYPNPATKNITIEYDSNKAIKYTIFDAIFQKVKQDELKSNEINLDSLEKGTYFIQIDNSIQQIVKL